MSCLVGHQRHPATVAAPGVRGHRVLGHQRLRPSLRDSQPANGGGEGRKPCPGRIPARSTRGQHTLRCVWSSSVDDKRLKNCGEMQRGVSDRAKLAWRAKSSHLQAAALGSARLLLLLLMLCLHGKLVLIRLPPSLTTGHHAPVCLRTRQALANNGQQCEGCAGRTIGDDVPVHALLAAAPWLTGCSGLLPGTRLLRSASAPRGASGRLGRVRPPAAAGRPRQAW